VQFSEKHNFVQIFALLAIPPERLNAYNKYKVKALEEVFYEVWIF